MDPDDRLAVSRVRYLLSLLLVPYVSRYLTTARELGAVVDDLTRRVYTAYEPEQPFDIDAAIREYIAAIESTSHGSDSAIDLEWRWFHHATTLLQAQNGPD